MKLKNLIAWAGLVVSIVTAAALVWTSIETREHHRLTATPWVLPVITSDTGREMLGILLMNEGSGPAKINYKSVELDGQTSDMESVVKKMQEEGLIVGNTPPGYIDLSFGSYLGVGRQKVILRVEPETVNPPLFERFDEFLHERLDVRYEVCSVYEECEPACTAKDCVASRTTGVPKIPPERGVGLRMPGRPWPL